MYLIPDRPLTPPEPKTEWASCHVCQGSFRVPLYDDSEYRINSLEGEEGSFLVCDDCRDERINCYLCGSWWPVEELVDHVCPECRDEIAKEG